MEEGVRWLMVFPVLVGKGDAISDSFQFEKCVIHCYR